MSLTLKAIAAGTGISITDSANVLTVSSGGTVSSGTQISYSGTVAGNPFFIASNNGTTLNDTNNYSGSSVGISGIGPIGTKGSSEGIVSGIGLYGISSGVGGIGAYGVSTTTGSNFGWGTVGICASTYLPGTTSGSSGVRGVCTSSGGVGVRGVAIGPGSAGVIGHSDNGAGLSGAASGSSGYDLALSGNATIFINQKTTRDSLRQPDANSLGMLIYTHLGIPRIAIRNPAGTVFELQLVQV
jgi:hypothetical protein